MGVIYGNYFQPSLRGLASLRSAPNAEALRYCRPVPPGRDPRRASKLKLTRSCQQTSENCYQFRFAVHVLLLAVPGFVRRAKPTRLGRFEQKGTKRTKGCPAFLFRTLFAYGRSMVSRGIYPAEDQVRPARVG